MIRSRSIRILPVVFAIAAAGLAATSVGDSAPSESPSQANLPDSAGKPFGIAERTPWTTSRFRGSPEPPMPYRAERVYPKLGFAAPTALTFAPGTERMFVVEERGNIYSIPRDPQVEQADVFLDMKEVVSRRSDAGEIVQSQTYGLVFHPKFAENRYCYVTYTVQARDETKNPLPLGTRVARFTVDRNDPPVCDLTSERVVIEWPEGGHNGGCLKFGPDGYLYIATGDGTGPYPPDPENVGQDVSDLLASILRIDVDREQNGLPYTIPADNPFVSLAGARGEIWAFGYRNPWKFSFDRKTGDLWVCDVGWELWEPVFRVHKGDNGGWSIFEGPQQIKAEAKVGPTPIVPPVLSIPHTDGASLTGGFVYRGKKYPELVGTYIFGDWETRRVWGITVDGDKIGPRQDLVEPTVRLVDFAEDHDGELYLLDYDDGSISQIVPNTIAEAQTPFPTRLSETGFFENTAEHRIAPGVIPFSVNAPRWADGAAVERFAAIPGTGAIRKTEYAHRVPGVMLSRTTDFPADSVFFETFSLPTDEKQPAAQRRIETQVLHFNGRTWTAYTYEWNDAQTDAVLVDRDGKSRVLTIADVGAPGGRRQQTWHYPSRTDCLRCHSMWTETLLGFTIPQLNRDHDFGGVRDNQIRTFRHIGVLEDVPNHGVSAAAAASFVPKPPEQLPRLVDPFDSTVDLSLRGRSYLHANCAHCHMNGGGGSSFVHLDYRLSLAELRGIGVRPLQGTLGVHDARIIAPGDPFRSMLYLRMAKLGSGHMPHLGSSVIDRRGLELIHDWVAQLPVHLEEDLLIERLARMAAADATGTRPAMAARRDKLIEEFLSRPDRAAMLARALHEGMLPEPAARKIVEVAAQSADAAVRDLFEPFVPEEQRIQRLGDAVRPAELLKLSGDVERGKLLFHKTNGVQCRNCHRIAGDGVELGPELSQVGKKHSREKLLENILDPSRTIEPAYATWLVETVQGQVVTGLLVRQDAAEIVLKDSENKERRIARADVEGAFPQQKSLMPDLLLKDLTAQQVADLLAYLESLK